MQGRVVRYLNAAGVATDASEAAVLFPVFGWFEIELGELILGAPLSGLLIVAFTWKIATEALHPQAGEPLSEFIERGGSYAAPLALAWCQGVRLAADGG